MLGRLRDRVLGRAQPPPPPPPRPPSILDAYVTSAPSPQNAVDIFAGEWSSTLPGLNAGSVPLFDDERVSWAIERFGGMTGRSVLELGPLEGGHTYQLVRAGATVTAIEAQTRAYLKCLIAKELFDMSGARFLLGDFMTYLAGEPGHVDVCFASGVLYHMRDPVRTLALLAGVADRLFLWTHVYDEDAVRASALLAPRFTGAESATYEGFEHTLHRFEYAQSLASNGFCGAGTEWSNWLTKTDLYSALDRFGWQIDDVGFDTPDHPHGPALALVATNDGRRLTRNAR